MEIMPGKQSAVCYICIRKMSWVFFRPKGICRKWYLPQCMLKVVRYKDFSSRWMLQKLSLVSSFL